MQYDWATSQTLCGQTACSVCFCASVVRGSQVLATESPHCDGISSLTALLVSMNAGLVCTLATSVRIEDSSGLPRITPGLASCRLGRRAFKDSDRPCLPLRHFRATQYSMGGPEFFPGRRESLFCRKGLSPQGELRVQVAAGNRTGSFVDVHTGRGKPRSPARQAGPTEIRDCTHCKLAKRLRQVELTLPWGLIS